MKIKRSGETLIIRESPGLLWVLGAFFIIISLFFVYGALGGYSNWNEASRLTVGTHLFFGLCGVVAGCSVIFSAPGTRIIIDRVNARISYRTRGLVRRREVVYTFDQIASFSLIEERDSDGDPVWSLGLELRDGETLKISRLESHDERFKRDFVFQANEFMHRQLPSYRDAEDESRQDNR